MRVRNELGKKHKSRARFVPKVADLGQVATRHGHRRVRGYFFRQSTCDEKETKYTTQVTQVYPERTCIKASIVVYQ